MAIETPANAEDYTQEDITSDKNLQTIRTFLELPDNQIDLAKVKLTIDHMIDPSINIVNSLKQLDAMAADVKARMPSNPSSRDKVEALRVYLFEAGKWNFNQPFRYDLDDPFGNNIRNKLLPTYLATRKGNCVSMPMLFIILGQKLGIDVTASVAPNHVFAKYRDEMGNLYNIEPSSGGHFARDVWMQQQFPMTEKALANGIYMQPLSKKETVVVMSDTLGEFYIQQRKPARSLVLSELELKYYPKNVQALLRISSGNHHLREQFFEDMRRESPKKKSFTVSEGVYRELTRLERNSWYWRAQAEALGWREEDKATLAKYQQRVDRAKLAQ